MKSDAVKFIRKKIIRILAKSRFGGDPHGYRCRIDTFALPKMGASARAIAIAVPKTYDISSTYRDCLTVLNAFMIWLLQMRISSIWDAGSEPKT
ncbi:hypothetical protein [Rhizobium sp. BR 314]|uniref:hypothetical protein n=1 Tax=Rhizobium sp. BR 314 TaxID=3040013 RepID=UPI0039BFFE33